MKLGLRCARMLTLSRLPSKNQRNDTDMGVSVHVVMFRKLVLEVAATQAIDNVHPLPWPFVPVLSRTFLHATLYHVRPGNTLRAGTMFSCVAARLTNDVERGSQDGFFRVNDSRCDAAEDVPYNCDRTDAVFAPCLKCVLGSSIALSLVPPAKGYDRHKNAYDKESRAWLEGDKCTSASKSSVTKRRLPVSSTAGVGGLRRSKSDAGALCLALENAMGFLQVSEQV